ncbi:MAG: hypothetical protein R8G60_04920 [Roseovarius pacificus]|nr:hypothetical protein [Roseovarius pacificus]
MSLPRIRIHTENRRAAHQFWKEELERLGIEQVRMLLANPEATGRGSRSSFNYTKQAPNGHGFPDREFVQEWLSKKEAHSERRQDRIYILAWVAAGASVIGVLLSLYSLFF